MIWNILLKNVKFILCEFSAKGWIIRCSETVMLFIQSYTRSQLNIYWYFLVPFNLCFFYHYVYTGIYLYESELILTHLRQLVCIYVIYIYLNVLCVYIDSLLFWSTSFCDSQSFVITLLSWWHCFHDRFNDWSFNLYRNHSRDS